jgi:hypothetical protein
MPTVFRWKPHVHIWKDGKECKIWLQSSEVAFNQGHATADLRALVAVTKDNQDELLKVWNEQFGN